MDKKGKGDMGYRNRPGRLGLDPVDTDAEAGRAYGFIIQQLFFFKFHTRKTLVVALLAIIGVLLVFPLALAGYMLLNNGGFPVEGWPLVIFSAAVGVILLINAGRNVIKSRH